MEWLPSHGYQGRYFLIHAVYSPSQIDQWHALGANFFDLSHDLKQEETFGAILERCHAHGAYAAVYLTHGLPMQPGYPAQLKPQPCLSREQYAALATRYPGTMLLMVDEFANNLDVSHPAQPTTRLVCAQNVVHNLRQLWDYWTPPAAIGRFTWENGLPPAYHYDAGTDLYMFELYRGQNEEIVCSRLRGTTRAYDHKFFGTSLTEYSWLSSWLSWMWSGGITGNPGTIGSHTGPWKCFPLLPTYSLADVVKGYYYCYFNGASVIGHEASPPSKDEVAKFVAFLKAHPRIEFPDARLAIVGGLGYCDPGKGMPRMDDARFSAIDWESDVFGFRNVVDGVTKPAKWANWGSPGEWYEGAYLRDLHLYRIAFPDCGNDTVWRQYTGTPLGPVDVIPATLPSDRLGRYQALWFLSMNVMTPELDARLRRYVSEGGTLVMNVEQLRDEHRQWSASSKQLLADLFGVEFDGVEPSPEVAAELAFTASNPFGLPQAAYHADHLRLYPVRLGSAQVVAKTDDGRPACVVCRHGKGTAVLTLSEWTWRLPEPMLAELIGSVANRAGRVLELSPPNRFLEPLVCPFTNRRGAAVAVFNNQVNHLDEPYYRKLYGTKERLVGGLQNQILEVDLREKPTARFTWDFPATDLAAYDEIRFRLRADGDKPGGGLYLGFIDQQGKKVSLASGLVKVSWLDGPGLFTKYVGPYDLPTPLDKKGGYLKKWQGDEGFDWHKVAGMTLVANRHANGPIRYRLHVLDVTQVSMMVDQKRTPERKNITYDGQANLNLDLLGLKLPKAKVYRAGTQMHLTPVPFQRQGQVLTFPVTIDSDWAEFLVQED
jgi:hypothetical protein